MTTIRTPMNRTHAFEVITNAAPTEVAPAMERDPAQWHQAVGIARQACARIFRDGGTATDAVRIFDLPPSTNVDWSRAVTLIAESMCRTPARRAA
jgi:hypothetical protein